MAAYLMTKIWPKHSAVASADTAELTQQTAVHSAELLLAGAPPDPTTEHFAILVSVSARLPHVQLQGSPTSAPALDAVSVVPFDRWDLEASWVSRH